MTNSAYQLSIAHIYIVQIVIITFLLVQLLWNKYILYLINYIVTVSSQALPFLPFISTNVHLHPLSLQTFRLSSVPHKNPLRHDYLGRGPINKRHVSELVIFQERLLYNTGESSYHAPTLTLPFCLQVSHCANNWTFVDTQYSMMAGQSI